VGRGNEQWPGGNTGKLRRRVKKLSTKTGRVDCDARNREGEIGWQMENDCPPLTSLGDNKREVLATLDIEVPGESRLRGQRMGGKGVHFSATRRYKDEKDLIVDLPE